MQRSRKGDISSLSKPIKLAEVISVWHTDSMLDGNYGVIEEQGKKKGYR